MKILIQRETCVGHARCQHVALDSVEVPAGQEALARRAVRACPEQALRIADDAPPA